MNNKKAFTLVELLVVIAIIGLIAALSVIALGNARSKSRDAKRVSNIKQMQTALELFFNDQGKYPTAIEWNTGSLYATSTFGTTTYMERIPSFPTGGDCGVSYNYLANSAGSDYSITYCLEGDIGSLSSGGKLVTASGQKELGTMDGLLGYYNFEEGAGNYSYDNSGNSNTLTWYGTGSRYVAGKVGAYAGSFNVGSLTNNYLKAANTNALNVSGNEMTMMAWVNPSYLDYLTSTGYGLGIARKGMPDCGTSTYGWWFVYENRNNGHSFAYTAFGNTSGGCAGGSQNFAVCSSFYPVVGTWYHIVVVIKDDYGYLYKDRELLCGPLSFPNLSVPDSSQYFYIGMAFDYFRGYIDDFRLYDRGLEGFEVSEIYDATK